MKLDLSNKNLSLALKKLKNGDAGAPFEKKVIQALHSLDMHNPVDYVRWMSKLKKLGVSQAQLVRAIKRHRQRIELRKKANFQQDKKSLIEAGFVIDAQTGDVQGLNGNKFARYILNNHELRYTVGGRFYFYEDGVWHFLNKNDFSRLLRDFLHQHEPDIWTETLENIYMSALKRETTKVDEMDEHRQFINLINGMLNLESLTLLPHKPEYHSSIQLPMKYDPDVKCPRFTKFLVDVFQGDEELIRNAEEVLGYCLTAETLMHKAIFMNGTGSNGKSVFAAVLSALVGKKNVASVPLKELENSFARLDLVGKTVNLVTENEVISRSGMQTGNFKTIVGGDAVRVEVKHGEAFTIKLVCKMVLATNNLPYSSDRSHGFLRRLHILPFKETFVDEPLNKNEREKLLKKNPKVKFKDKKLQEKLLDELPGILNLALEGLDRLRKNGWQFSPSKAVTSELENYINDTSPLNAFVSECLVQGDKSDWQTYRQLNIIYKDWCEDNGHRKAGEMARRQFSNHLQEILKQDGFTFKLAQRGGERGITRLKIRLTGTGSR